MTSMVHFVRFALTCGSHCAVAALLALRCFAVSANAADVTPLRGMYITSGAFARGWSDGLKVGGVLATRPALEAALDHSIADIKRLGFNTLMVDPGYYAGQAFSYDEYSEIILQRAARGGIAVLLGLPVACPVSVPGCWSDPRERNEMYTASCLDTPDNRAFVDRFFAEIALTGFLCGFESFGQPNVTPQVLAAMRDLTVYIRQKGKIFVEVPAAGVSDRANGVFTLMTPQVNPKLYPNPGAMLAEVAKDASRYGGAEIVFYHAQTIPKFGYPVGAPGTVKWHQLQYDAFVRVRPSNVTVFDYQKLITTRDRSVEYFQPRGWLMSVMARLDDPSLVFYDPLESDFASAVMHAEPFNVRYAHDGLDALMGHGVDGGTASIPKDGGLKVPLAIGTQGGVPLVSTEAGTFSALVKASWPAGTRDVHGLLQAPCLDAGRNCLQVQFAPDDRLQLILRDARGTQITVDAPMAPAWRRGEWNQVAATWDRPTGALALYINGLPIGVEKTHWDAGSTQLGQLEKHSLVIGNLGYKAPDNEHGLDGELDEVRLYSRALTGDKINQLYQSVARSR
jgi:hypothetical protein